MNRLYIVMAFVLAALASPARAQSLSPLGGPTQGIVYDAPSHSLRQVSGTYGSAMLGPALWSGLEFASLAQNGAAQNGAIQNGRGILCGKEQCTLAGQSETALLADQTGLPEGAAWSTDGKAGVIYSRSGAWIRVLHELKAGAQHSVSTAGGDLSAVEMSPDGQHVVFAITGEHPGVFELTEQGNFVPLLAARNPVALAYGGTTLYVLDGDRIAELAADGIARSWPIEAVHDGVDIQVSREPAGKTVVYVAGGSDHALFVYDAQSHNLTGEIPLPFAPSQVQPAGAGSYLLTTRTNTDDLLWAYSAGRGVFFVPVTPEETTPRKVRR